MSRKSRRNIETPVEHLERIEAARRALDNIAIRRAKGYVNRKAERSKAEPFNKETK